MKSRLGEFWTANQGAIVKLAIALVMAVIGALGNQELRAPKEVEKEVEKLVVKEVERKYDADDPRSFPSGWIDDKEEVQAVVSKMLPPVFGETPAGQAEVLPKSVYGWKYYAALPIRGPPVKNQGRVGSCVGFGTAGALERGLAAAIAAGKPLEFFRYTEEAIYGFSRVQIGGRQIRGDGSVGAWAARAVTEIGCVPRAKYPDADLTEYSEDRCRNWGAGVPSTMLAIAAKYKVVSATQIKSLSDFMKAAANGYFTAVCSNVGFDNRDGTIGTRDARGVIEPLGTWAHCMLADGYHTDADGAVYVHITNSWGPNAHRGPVGWGEPGTDGFWIRGAVADRMFRQGDSWAFSGVPGFPRQRLPDFFIRHDRNDDGVEVGRLALDLHRRGPKIEVALAW